MQSSQQKQSKNYWYPAIIFFAGLVIGLIIMSLIKPVEKSRTPQTYAGIGGLIQQTDSLQTEFSTVQELNEQYSAILNDKKLDTTKLKMLDSLNVQIIKTESAFLKKLDYMQINSATDNNSLAKLIEKITTAYRSVLNTSDALNSTRNSFNIGNTNFSFDQNMISNMQTELSLKEMQIQGMQAQLGIRKSFTNTDSRSTFNNLLQQQDSINAGLLDAQKKRAENLTAYNSKLQRDNDNLRAEVDALQKSKTQQNVNANTTPALSTVSPDYMNDQLSLAQADCYLSRADSRQTISNAKQRKDLLQNALQILNNLKQSSNTATKQQVELKLTELKTIAANNHD